jgi:hypothetical protein
MKLVEVREEEDQEDALSGTRWCFPFSHSTQVQAGCV